MGGCLGTGPESSSEFRKRKQLDVDEFDGPLRKRSCTDVPYLLLLIIFIAVWLGLIYYCIVNGDIRRITIGYDDCGNICGVRNYINYGSRLPNTKHNCNETDMSAKGFMLIYPRDKWDDPYEAKKRECVADCLLGDSTGSLDSSRKPSYKQYFHRCYPNDPFSFAKVLVTTDLQDYFQKAAEDINLCSAEIIYMCAFALGLSVLMILLFRYFAGILVWFVLICVVIASIGVSAFLWVWWKSEKDKYDVEKSGGFAVVNASESNATTYFVFAVISTCATVIILLLIFGMRKSLHLVVHLFKEAGKACQAMPLIVLQPFITFAAIITLLFLWAYFFLWIESAGIAQQKSGNTDRITFKKDEVIQFARGYNVVAAFWLVQFIIGCQHMVIAGAVATWYFTRKKNEVDSPLSKSFGYLFSYHLGTVAMGSLMIAIVQIIRVIFKMLESTIKDPKNDVTRTLYKAFSCCLYCLEKILVFLTRNAYIEVAIYGDGLWTSGKRAYSVLVNNSLRVIVINSVGDFVLFLGKALVVATSVFIACKLLQGKEGLNYIAVPLTIIGVFAYLVAHAFMTAFEMIIDTLFICFCEDVDMNDGQERPYYMNRKLMEFVESSQKVLRVGDVAVEPKSQTTRFISED